MRFFLGPNPALFQPFFHSFFLRPSNRFFYVALSQGTIVLTFFFPLGAVLGRDLGCREGAEGGFMGSGRQPGRRFGSLKRELLGRGYRWSDQAHRFFYVSYSGPGRFFQRVFLWEATAVFAFRRFFLPQTPTRKKHKKNSIPFFQSTALICLDMRGHAHYQSMS